MLADLLSSFGVYFYTEQLFKQILLDLYKVSLPKLIILMFLYMRANWVSDCMDIYNDTFLLICLLFLFLCTAVMKFLTVERSFAAKDFIFINSTSFQPKVLFKTLDQGIMVLQCADARRTMSEVIPSRKNSF